MTAISPSTQIPLPGERRRLSRGRSGFTILEVALASFVLIFALAGGIVTIQAGFRTLDVARGLTLASQIAQSEIESIRLCDWSHLPSSGPINLSSVFTTDPSLATRFSGNLTISDTAGKVGSMKDIQIDVSWTTYDGVLHTRTFKANYAKNGLYDYDYTKPR
jgi:hypothetical protein